MRGFGSMLHIALWEADVATARVVVTVEWPSGEPRTPVYIHERTLLLMKRESSWRVARVVEMRHT